MKLKIKTCKNCSSSFKPKKALQQFCKEKCRKENYYRNRYGLIVKGLCSVKGCDAKSSGYYNTQLCCKYHYNYMKKYSGGSDEDV